MENIKILPDVFSSFTWEEYVLCVAAAFLFAGFGATVRFTIEEIKEKSVHSALFFFIYAVILLGIAGWCVYSFWKHPIMEMKLVVIIWALIWTLIGFFQVFARKNN